MDAAPPHPPTPKAAAKGLHGVLKGKPAWMWIAGVTVMVGVAYMVWKRGQVDTSTADAQGAPADSAVGPVGGAYDYTGAGTDPSLGGGVTPAPSQGAFGGFDTSQTFPSDTTPVDSAGSPEGASGGSLVVNVYPGPIAGVDAPVATTSHAQPTSVTGGGHPARSVSHHQPVAKVNTAKSSPRLGRKYITRTTANGRVQHLYESKPGKGDFGKGRGTTVTLPKKKHPTPPKKRR